MRKILLFCLAALPAAAQTAASVCATVLMSDDKVRCMQTVAGHTVEPGAAAVCSTVLMSDDKIECLRGALDKHYRPDELSTCRAVLMGGEKATCMGAAGASPQPQGRRDDDRRRRRDDDDDDDDSTRIVRLTNNTQVIFDRVYYRRVDGRRFHEVRMHDVAEDEGSFDVRVPDEKLEMCAETTTGYYLYWPKVKRNEQLVLDTDEDHWHKGRCRDR